MLLIALMGWIGREIMMRLPGANRIKHTVVVRPSCSYCGNCDANVLPGQQRRCTSCGTHFWYSATNTIGDKSLDEYAAQFQEMWPNLTFIGVATINDSPKADDTHWRLYERRTA